MDYSRYPLADLCLLCDQGTVSPKSRKLFGPEKPFVRLRPAYSAKQVFLGETSSNRDIRELKHQTFLRSRTSTGSHWSNNVRTAHVMTFASSRRRRQNGTFQVEGRTPQKYAVILFIGDKLLTQNHEKLFFFSLFR